MKPALVFDVNVLIDAIDTNSRFHDSAAEALSARDDDNRFVSRQMLKTLRHKLIEFQAEPAVADEYIELLTASDAEFGMNLTVLDGFPVHDYDIVDRYGRHDAEDCGVVSLVDAVEKRIGEPVVLVTGDQPLTGWCLAHETPALTPAELLSRTREHAEPQRRQTLDYMSRRTDIHPEAAHDEPEL